MGVSLQRGLGLLEATTLVVGGTIGASIFLVPSAVAAEVNAPGLALLTWVLTGFLALTGALSFAELASAIPETGGTYQFLKRAFPGTPIAFLFGWMMFFAYAAGATAVVTSMAAQYAGHFLARFVEFDGMAPRAFAVGIIGLLAFTNCLGVRQGAQTQNVLTFLKLGGILAIVGICFFVGEGKSSPFQPMLPPETSGAEIVGSVGTAMILSIFSYSGWYFITHVAGEVRDPARTLPRSIFIGIGIVLVLYLAVNAGFLYALPFDRVKSSPRIAADALDAAVGPLGADVIAVVVILSALGSSNAQLLNYPRIVFSLSRDGYFFERLGRIHPTRQTPTVAIIAFASVAAFFALIGTYQQILSFVGFVIQLFMALTVVGLIVLRRREPELPRPFKVPGYPIVPLLYLAILTWYLGNLLVNRLGPSLVGIGIVLTGLPFYWYWRRKRNSIESGARS